MIGNGGSVGRLITGGDIQYDDCLFITNNNLEIYETAFYTNSGTFYFKGRCCAANIKSTQISPTGLALTDLKNGTVKCTITNDASYAVTDLICLFLSDGTPLFRGTIQKYRGVYSQMGQKPANCFLVPCLSIGSAASGIYAQATSDNMNYSLSSVAANMVTPTQTPAITDVRNGTGFGQNATQFTGTAVIPNAANVLNGVAVDAATGTLTSVDPGVGNVVSGTAYEINSVNKTGTYSAASTDPGVSNVRNGTSYEINSTNFSGTLDLPSVNDVRSGTAFDNSSKTGLLDLPDVSNVKSGVSFDQGTKTGTLPSPSLPATTDVRSNVTYGNSGDHVGNLILPTPSTVARNTKYGANGNELSGLLGPVGSTTDSAKKNLVAALKLCLLEINTSNSFRQSFLHVYENPINFEKATEYTSVNLYEGKEVRENRELVGNDALYTEHCKILLECFGKNVNDPNAYRQSIIADVKDYFGNNYYIQPIGGQRTVFQCMYADSMPWGFEANAPFTGVDITLEVWYNERVNDSTKMV